MKARFWKSLLCAFVPGFAVFSADAATSLFSDYGQIQNVQKYSSNPFWTPNSPYNQRLPQPVYVQGADLNTEDCIKVVQSLVSVQCMARDNCKNVALGDIRPAIMVQLSNLPGKNYVSSCSGYIDGVFESYVAQFGANTPNRAVAFPGATVPNTSVNGDNNGVQLYNPYQRQTPEWKQEIIDKSQELKKLQNQNGANNNHLSASAFPTTYADLSFTERMQNTAAGYTPYKDLKAYRIPDFQTAEEWCSEHSGEPYCEDYYNTKAKNLECTNEAQKRITTSNGGGNLILYAARDKAGATCKVITCKQGYKPTNDANRCWTADCTSEMSGIAHVVYAERINEGGACIIKQCDNGFIPLKTGRQCIKKDCTAEAQDRDPDATYAEMDENGVCKIKNCDGNKIPMSDGSRCVDSATFSAQNNTSGVVGGDNSALSEQTEDGHLVIEFD